MNALEVTKLCKSFPGFQLSDVSFTLPAGCIMGFVGENGAGKTTVIKLILDILHKDSGTVTILGRDNGQELRLTKEDVGVVMDEVGIPECLTLKQVEKVMKHTFRRWDSGEFHRLSEKLSLPQGKPFRDFSRGMKMKLGIAIAMSHGAKLLLLDEATSGLDPVVRDEVVDMFMEYTRNEENSIFISSHIVSDLEKLCDIIAFLHNGRLLLCQEKDKLLSEYAMAHCTAAQLEELDPEAVLFSRSTPYGLELLVMRSRVPQGLKLSPVGIEELFLSMVKGGC